MEKNSKKQFIYSLVDPVTNEVRYIGKTSDLKNRYSRHLQKCYLEKYDKNTYKSNWIKSLLKVGEKPIMNIIQECDSSNVNELEIYWINKFKNDGYRLTNLSEGGEFGVDWNGRKHTQETKNKIHNSKIKYMMPVIHYDIKGNILAEYESLIEASRTSGHHIYLISNCCKNKGSYTVGGKHFWRKNESVNPTTFRYKGDKFDYIPYNKNIQINSRKVCKYDLDGKFLQKYDSIRKASIDNNCDKANILSCCKRKVNKKTGKFIIVKGYTWRYNDETNGEDLFKNITLKLQ
mgnify:CR=1 FL=1